MSAHFPPRSTRIRTVRDDLRKDRLSLISAECFRTRGSGEDGGQSGGLPKGIVRRVVTVCRQFQRFCQLPSDSS